MQQAFYYREPVFYCAFAKAELQNLTLKGFSLTKKATLLILNLKKYRGLVCLSSNQKH